MDTVNANFDGFDDVMMDLETLGTSSRSPVVAIGAVRMNFATKQLGMEFYQTIDIRSYDVVQGFEVSYDTIAWWLKQSDEAISSTFNSPDSKSLTETLIDFGRYLNPNYVSLNSRYHTDDRIWGNGSDFDNVILHSAYQTIGAYVPWKWFNNRCYRTIKALRPDVKIDRSFGTAHNALNDAKNQAEHLLRLWEDIGL